MAAEESAIERQRLGIALPRSSLLPPYLAVNPFFTDYTDAIDAVFKDTVDSELWTLRNLRNMWAQSSDTEAYVDQHTIIPKEAWPMPSRDLLAKNANTLGINLQTAQIISDDGYQALARFVGIYWFGKGTDKFMEFINWCLGTDFKVYNMWTENYTDFFIEGDAAIGTPIWDGGTWYPTTHITVEAKGGLHGVDLITLQTFIYEISNYNLVLWNIDISYDMPIVPDNSPDGKTADIVAIAMANEWQIVLSNFKNMATTAPSSYENEQLPSTYLAMGGVPVDFSTALLLAEPSSWMWIDDAMTKKVPVYNTAARVVRDEADIGDKLISNNVGPQFNLVYGPIQWMKIPGSSKTTQMIPYFGIGTYTVMDGVSVSARSVGAHRTNLLTNPAGFIEYSPNVWLPYWD